VAQFDLVQQKFQVSWSLSKKAFSVNNLLGNLRKVRFTVNRLRNVRGLIFTQFITIMIKGALYLFDLEKMILKFCQKSI
jgi:hypothetical protein